jgi:dTDP-glucose pyrophosphorylase
MGWIPEAREIAERIIEKPNVPPSSYAVTGLYFYANRSWRKQRP